MTISLTAVYDSTMHILTALVLLATLGAPVAPAFAEKTSVNVRDPKTQKLRKVAECVRRGRVLICTEDKPMSEADMLGRTQKPPEPPTIPPPAFKVNWAASH